MSIRSSFRRFLAAASEPLEGVDSFDVLLDIFLTVTIPDSILDIGIHLSVFYFINFRIFPFKIVMLTRRSVQASDGLVALSASKIDMSRLSRLSCLLTTSDI